MKTQIQIPKTKENCATVGWLESGRVVQPAYIILPHCYCKLVWSAGEWSCILYPRTPLLCKEAQLQPPRTTLVSDPTSPTRKPTQPSISWTRIRSNWSKAWRLGFFRGTEIGASAGCYLRFAQTLAPLWVQLKLLPSNFIKSLTGLINSTPTPTRVHMNFFNS